MIQVSRDDTFIKIRNELIQAGLVEYQKGKKGCPSKIQSIEKNSLFYYNLSIKMDNEFFYHIFSTHRAVIIV